MLSDRKRSKSGFSSRGKILVTGASGGSGRRVVRDLLAARRKVRALTRSRERLIEALATVGVDAEDAEKKGMLDIFVSDLFNIKEEMFEGIVGIASCTGAKVGPKDDVDRSKYFQGIKFYPPVVLDDNPETVDYIGIRNLVEGAKKYFGSSIESGEIPVLTFSDPEVVRSQWGAVDDVVMGGVSKSNVRVQDDELIFGGFVSTDNFGGFASARTVDFDTPMNLGAYDGLVVRCRGDGKSYKMILRCEKKWDGISHCYTFPTKSGEWTDVRIPFKDFITVFRAKTLKDGKPIDPASIFAFQIMLSKFEYDGELNDNFSPGPFELKIASVRAYKDGKSPVYPKIVHIGSASTTKILRKNEFAPEDLPPIVQLSDSIGRILEWKLAGEDVIRTSGIPYCILRACALTEEDTVGVESLKFEQGDFMTGKISRDDLSQLIVQAFSAEELTNVTTEVARNAEGQDADMGPAAERMKALQKDAESERTFGPFPFVPEEAKV